MSATAPELLPGTAVLVTGGGTGIGRGIAETFMRAGARVAIAGRRAAVLETAAADLSAAAGDDEGHGEVIAVPGDVSTAAGAEALVAGAVEALGTLHVLVNNAGVARVGALEEMSPQDVEAVIDVDLKGPLWMTRAAIPVLAAHREDAHGESVNGESRGAGRAVVINVSSSVTFSVLPNYAVYTAAKAGLDAATRCLARDLAPRGVRVNAISPGVVETPLFSTMMPEKVVPRALSSLERQTPLGRLGAPADVAGMALFLASPAAAWITGAVIPVDGGISLVS